MGISVPHQAICKTSSPQAWDTTPKIGTGSKQLVLQYSATKGSYLRQTTVEFILFLGFAHREEEYIAAQDSTKSLSSVSSGNGSWGCSLSLFHVGTDTPEGTPRHFFFEVSFSCDFLTQGPPVEE